MEKYTFVLLLVICLPVSGLVIAVHGASFSSLILLQIFNLMILKPGITYVISGTIQVQLAVIIVGKSLACVTQNIEGVYF